MFRGLMLVLPLLAAAGCTSPMQLAMDPVQAGTAPRTPSARKRIPVYLQSTQDARPEVQKQSAGRIGGREVVSADFTQWIDRSLQQLGGRKFAIASSPEGAWEITPKLRQFYAASLAVSKNTNIVLELQIRTPEGATLNRIYRGRLTAVNWWNSSGEMESAFQAALKHCLDQIAANLDELVATAPPSAPDKVPN